MSNLEAKYSEISNAELIIAFSEIDQFHDEAQEIIKNEIKSRGIEEKELKEEVSQYQEKNNIKAEEPLNFLVVLFFIITGLPGMIIGYFISSVYRVNGYTKKAEQVWSWAIFGFIVQLTIFFINKFK